MLMVEPESDAVTWAAEAFKAAVNAEAIEEEVLLEP
jgi:hypothetical protein